MEIIKGLLIDPENQSITEVEITPDPYEGGGASHLESMYKHLKCDCVDLARHLLEYLPSMPNDDVWVDDIGSWGNCPYMFMLPNYVPLIGRALILGHDDFKGESISHTLTAEDIEALRRSIRWLKREIC